MGGSWLCQWFRGHGPRRPDALHARLTRVCRQEAALACHLAERARALRFAAHRVDLEGVAERDRQNAHALAREIGCEAALSAVARPDCRSGTLTAAKLIQDLEETEDLRAQYLDARRLTSDQILRGTLERLASDAARGARTIRGILAMMDSYVTDAARGDPP